MKKKLIQQLDDGQQDVEMLIDDDACKIRIGECFLSVSNEHAEDYITNLLNDENKELKSLQKEFDTIKDNMSNTKSILYAKFGNTINLEEDNKHLMDKK